MSRRRYTPEQVIGRLREAEVALTQGQTRGQVHRSLGGLRGAPPAVEVSPGHMVRCWNYD